VTGKGIRTLVDQVAGLRAYSSNPQQRVRTGFESIDILCEGPAPGEVFTILGRSYSGKSIVAQNIIVNNPQLGSIFFSLEMPYILAVQRMFAMWSDIPNYTVQEQVKGNTLTPMLESMAEEMVRHLIVDHSAVSTHDMMYYVNAYEDYFGAKPDFIVVDYLELVSGVKTSGEGWIATEAAAQQMKDLAKEAEIPVFLVHQTNKQEPEWEPPSRSSARGGGYTEADFMVGMWRPGLNPKMPYEQKVELGETILFDVLKNRVFGKHNPHPLEYRITPSLRLEGM
jgi:replicative DNA helicase